MVSSACRRHGGSWLAAHGKARPCPAAEERHHHQRSPCGPTALTQTAKQHAGGRCDPQSDHAALTRSPATHTLCNCDRSTAGGGRPARSLRDNGSSSKNRRRCASGCQPIYLRATASSPGRSQHALRRADCRFNWHCVLFHAGQCVRIACPCASAGSTRKAAFLGDRPGSVARGTRSERGPAPTLGGVVWRRDVPVYAPNAIAQCMPYVRREVEI